MKKDKDLYLQQLKAYKSSVDLNQKYKIKVENDKASKRRKESISNQGKSQQQPIGSIQKKSICHIKLQDLVSSSQSSSETFQNVAGKEKSGKLCCLGRGTTTILKRNEEMAEIKRAHANKMEQLKEAHANEINEQKEKNQIFMQRMEEKFQLFLNIVLNQSNSRLNMEALAALFSTPPDDNSAPCSRHQHTPQITSEEHGESMNEGLDELDVEEDEDITLKTFEVFILKNEQCILQYKDEFL